MRSIIYFLLILSTWISPVVWCTSSSTVSCEDCSCHINSKGLIDEIDCENRNLSEIPEFILDSNYSNVERLFLDNNNIYIIRKSDFSGLKTLKVISITYNKLSYIEDHAFKDLVLNKLDLSHNLLTNSSFEPDSFEGGNNNIQLLKLSYNLLICPPPQLAKRNNLVNLNLANNPMDPILKANSFKGYSPRLDTLDLTSCGLQVIEENAFSYKNLPAINNLYLDNNNFTVLTPKFFQGANIRGRLTLNNCSIREIKSRTFTPLNSINKLILNNNNLSNQTSRRPFYRLRVNELQMINCSLKRVKRNFFHMAIERTLDLRSNQIDILRNDTFANLTLVRKIFLTNNVIKRVVGKPFQSLSEISKLNLNHNQLDDESLDFLGHTNKLLELDISYNHFTKLPNISQARNLIKLYVINNSLSFIEKSKMDDIRRLEVLKMGFNHNLNQIEQDTLDKSKELKILDISFSALTSLPNMQELQNLQELNIRYSKIRHLSSEFCNNNPDLKILFADHNLIEEIPDLTNCSQLSFIYFDNNKIKRIEEKTFAGLQHLEQLYLQNNEIEYIHPRAFHGLKRLDSIYLFNNKIPGLPEDLFKNLTRLKTIKLHNNRLTRLPRNIFESTRRLHRLTLNKNFIEDVDDAIFPKNMTWLQFLNISDNPYLSKFPLPPSGFPFLQSLSMSNVPRLLDPPTLKDIPRVLEIQFTYAYHCCIFKDHLRKPENYFYLGNFTNDNDTVGLIIRPPAEELTLPEDISAGLLFPGKINPFDPASHDEVSAEDVIDALKDFEKQWNVTLEVGDDGKIDVISHQGDEEKLVAEFDDDVMDLLTGFELPNFVVTPTIKCFPHPNYLSPCQNLLDPDPLPIFVWIIWFVAVIGNIAVLFVLFVSKEKIRVPQIFICNLAFADFLLGVYLAFLGGVDLKTRGQSFYKSALHWQMGAGCKSAGFIAVFACELSVLILASMTFERYHTIAHSFKQGRIKKRYVLVILSVCWITAGIFAMLPLVGLNSYSDVAVCLPFRTSGIGDKIYIALILSVNLMVFLVIMSFYIIILYIFYRSPAAVDTSKKEKVVIALKMGILVLTNLVCWLPLAVVGYAAISNHHIIDYIAAKFFVVMIFPINACLNPFIYTILTKGFVHRVKGICKKKNNRMLSSANKTSSFRLSIRRNSIASTSDTTSAHRTNSPRCDIDYDKLAKRHNHRSFSVQFVLNNNSNSMPQSPSTPTGSPAPYMGRRYSSPAIFGPEGHHSLFGRNLELRQITPEETKSANASPAELHRIHTINNQLSTVHEESDCEFLEEEVPKSPYDTMSRRYSDPDIKTRSLSPNTTTAARLKLIHQQQSNVHQLETRTDASSSSSSSLSTHSKGTETERSTSNRNKECQRLSTSSNPIVYINPHSSKLSKNTEETDV